MSDQTCEFPDLKAIVQYTGEPKAESGALSWKQLMETGEKALEELKEEMAKKLEDIAVNQVLSLPKAYFSHLARGGSSLEFQWREICLTVLRFGLHVWHHWDAERCDDLP